MKFVLVLALLLALTDSAPEKTVKYQLSSKAVTIAAKPTNSSEIKSETLQLLQIENSPSYGVQNPDFGILSVTLKSHYGPPDATNSTNSTSSRKKRSADTTLTPLYTQLLLVNDDLAPVATVHIANSSSSKTFG